MEERIAVLERDVDAIKAELAVIRRDRADVAELGIRVAHVEQSLVTMAADISQLKGDLARLTEEVVPIRIELIRLNTQQAQYVTMAKLQEVESNLKGWMLGIALTVLTLNFGMNAIFFNAQKVAPAIKPAQAQHVVPLTSPPPAIPG